MTENNQDNINYQNNDNNEFDLRTEVFKLLHFWKYFVLGVVISLFVTFLYNRYTKPVYNTTCKILVKDNAKSSSNNILQEFDLFGTRSNIINEIGILKSKTLSRKTVTDLKLYISYFHSSDKLNRTIEIYKDCPFIVEIDTTHKQLLNNFVYIQIISKDKYSLEIENIDENQSYFDFQNNISELNINSNKNNTKKILKFGEQFCDENFSFNLKINPEFKQTLNFERNYLFLIENPLSVGTMYSSSIEVAPIEKDASILEISLKSNVPDKAIDFLNKLCENYINCGLEEKNITAYNTIDFIDNQLSGITDSLTLVENVLENFKLENKVISVSEESKLAFDKIAEQDKTKALQNIEIKYYEYIRDYLKAKNDYTDIIAPATMGINNTSMTLLVSQLVTLSQEKSRLSVNSTEKNPYFTAIENEITSAKKALLDNINNSLNISKLQLVEINKQIDKTEVEINKIPKKERQLLTIQRKFIVSDATYSYLLQKKAEASIAKASNIADNKIIDKAEVFGKIHPKKSFNYLIAIIAGLFIPFLIIKIFDYINDTIRDKSDIEANTSFPLLGAVAHSKYPSPLVVINNSRSMVSETLRSVKANIDFIASEKKCKIIVLTSTISGEGKTFCSMNIACAFALSDKKTLLIGADLRKPKIFEDFNLTNEKGLTSYLIGKMELNEVINQTHVKNLSLITAGPVPPNPSELLSSNKMKEVLEVLKQQFDYIIIDTAPIGIVTDAVFLMRNADANIYVLRHNYTSKKVLGDLNDIIKTTGIKNLFLILNNVTYKKKKYGGYYNRYGYVYTYNEGYYEE